MVTLIFQGIIVNSADSVKGIIVASADSVMTYKLVKGGWGWWLKDPSLSGAPVRQGCIKQLVCNNQKQTCHDTVLLTWIRIEHTLYKLSEEISLQDLA